MNVGDLVLVLNEYQIPGTARKLNKKWIGPFKIERVIREGAAYTMSNPFNPEQNLLSRAAEKLKRFHPEVEFLEAQEIECIDEEPADSTDQEMVAEEPIPRYPTRIRRPKIPFSP